MNKKFLPIIIILSIVLSLTLLVACNDSEQDPHQFLNVKLTDGTSVDTFVNVQYKYGEPLSIFDTLQIVLEYRDGSVTLTSESPEANDVNISYSKEDGTTIEAFNKYSILAPGNYTVSVSYKGSTATLSVYISKADFKDNYRFYIKEASSSVKPSTSRYDYGSENMEIALYTTSGTELNRNLINSLYALNSDEKQEYDAIESETEKITYLNNHLRNYISFDSTTGIIGTTGLLPGSYFMFAIMNETETEVSGYTKPVSPLTVNKGKIVFSNEFKEQLGVHGEYTFNNYVSPGEEPVMTKNGTKALSLMEVGINYDYNNANITLEGAEYSLGSLGTFVFTDTTDRVDASDNGQLKQVKFTLIEDLDARYIVTNSATSTTELRWSIPLVITKGQIYAPYYYGDVYSDVLDGIFVYDGTQKDVNNYLNLSNKTAFINTSGNKQTNAGQYTATISLKDNINYEWLRYNDAGEYYGQYGDATSGNVTFTWNLSKAAASIETIVSYLGEEVESSSIQYVKGVANNKSISIELSSDYITEITAEGLSITWANDYGGATEQHLSVDTTKHTASNTVTFTELGGYGLSEYVNVYLNIPESNNYMAFDNQCVTTITVYKAIFTAEEVNAIFNAISATKQIDPISQTEVYVYPDLNIHEYYYIADPTNHPDESTTDHYKINPTTIPAAITYNNVTLGSWKLYHFSELTADVEYTNNQEFTTLPSNNGWHLIFFIEDPCVGYVPENLAQVSELEVDVASVSFTRIEITPPQNP